MCGCCCSCWPWCKTDQVNPIADPVARNPRRRPTPAAGNAGAAAAAAHSILAPPARARNSGEKAVRVLGQGAGGSVINVRARRAVPVTNSSMVSIAQTTLNGSAGSTTGSAGTSARPSPESGLSPVQAPSLNTIQVFARPRSATPRPAPVGLLSPAAAAAAVHVPNLGSDVVEASHNSRNGSAGGSRPGTALRRINYHAVISLQVISDKNCTFVAFPRDRSLLTQRFSKLLELMQSDLLQINPIEMYLICDNDLKVYAVTNNLMARTGISSGEILRQLLPTFIHAFQHPDPTQRKTTHDVIQEIENIITVNIGVCREPNKLRLFQQVDVQLQGKNGGARVRVSAPFSNESFCIVKLMCCDVKKSPSGTPQPTPREAMCGNGFAGANDNAHAGYPPVQKFVNLKLVPASSELFAKQAAGGSGSGGASAAAAACPSPAKSRRYEAADSDSDSPRVVRDSNVSPHTHSTAWAVGATAMLPALHALAGVTPEPSSFHRPFGTIIRVNSMDVTSPSAPKNVFPGAQPRPMALPAPWNINPPNGGASPAAAPQPTLLLPTSHGMMGLQSPRIGAVAATPPAQPQPALTLQIPRPGTAAASKPAEPDELALERSVQPVPPSETTPSVSPSSVITILGSMRMTPDNSGAAADQAAGAAQPVTPEGSLTARMLALRKARLIRHGTATRLAAKPTIGAGPSRQTLALPSGND